MFVLEPSPTYRTLRYKLGWVDIRDKDVAQVETFLKQNDMPLLDVGKFIATELSKKNASPSAQSDISKILDKKIKEDCQILDGWNQPLICLYNLGLLLDPELNIQASNLLKDISKNTYLILLWDYFCDEPGFFHWGFQKQTFNLDLSNTGILKIPFKNDI